MIKYCTHANRLIHLANVTNNISGNFHSAVLSWISRNQFIGIEVTRTLAPTTRIVLLKKGYGRRYWREWKIRSGNCFAHSERPSIFGILGALHRPVATTTASKSYAILQLFIGFGGYRSKPLLSTLLSLYYAKFSKPLSRLKSNQSGFHLRRTSSLPIPLWYYRKYESCHH